MTKRSTTTEFILKARKIHDAYYDYSLVNYIRCDSKIVITCKHHGPFYQTPSSHLYGKGCPTCGVKKQSDAKRDTLKYFVTRAKKVHGNRYSYLNSIYTNNETKIEIICKIHGPFFQSSTCHLYQKQGCPKCKLSKTELNIHKFLQQHKIKFISQKTFDGCRNPKTNQKLKFDFYIPLKNLLIEYDGEQHFLVNRRFGGYTSTIKDLKDIQHRDKIKTKYAKFHRIKLLRIKYTQKEKINDILKYQFKT